MTGEVVGIQVDYLTAGPEGPKRTTVDLAAIHRHCRPERVEELLEDLALVCADALAGRHPEDSGRLSSR
jgi:hypothetical protein